VLVLSTEYFKLPDRITASELQQIIMLLEGNCDYQKALDIIKILGATKEKNRYWVLSHYRAWLYIETIFGKELKEKKINDMEKLIEFMRYYFNRE
jgi:hypothetical protein